MDCNCSESRIETWAVQEPVPRRDDLGEEIRKRGEIERERDHEATRGTDSAESGELHCAIARWKKNRWLITRPITGLLGDLAPQNSRRSPSVRCNDANRREESRVPLLPMYKGLGQIQAGIDHYFRSELQPWKYGNQTRRHSNDDGARISPFSRFRHNEQDVCWVCLPTVRWIVFLKSYYSV